MNNARLLSAFFTSVALVSAYPRDSSSPIVDLGYTNYEGTSLVNGISQWLGMRYAAPPVGDLRFRAPRDPIPNATLQIANKVLFSSRLSIIPI